jgi:hypothetical protein
MNGQIRDVLSDLSIIYDPKPKRISTMTLENIYVVYDILYTTSLPIVIL